MPTNARPNCAAPTYNLEIRAAQGGADAALFAGELLAAYQRYAARRGWQLTIVDSQPGPAGGLRSARLTVRGEGIDVLLAEAGTHRVQRVASTDRRGRRHTSAITVSVLQPGAEQQLDIDPADLRVEFYRASGAGGQHRNKTDSAVRITHLPTGMVATAADERRQGRNRELAMSRLRERIGAQRAQIAAARRDHERRQQVGTGSIAEHVRTYIYDRDQVIDHRCGLRLRLRDVLAGKLEPIGAG